MTDECLFCQIISGTISSERVFEDDLVVVINDINAQAPVHQLLMPRRHVGSAGDLGDDDGAMLGRLFAVGASLARAAGFDERGYRMVTNIGADGGQSVPHLHIHLLGGRRFSWPPG